ncbi:MAG: hypothetical protein HYY18_10745 [Planctomycetes bacterium]|nr:hypothetical protein [Planctomycetota bacterium]
MAQEVTDIQKLLNTAAASAAGPARPGGWYSASSDCVFYHLEDVPYRAVRVDDLLTVYEAEDDARIVGVQIMGIRKLPTDHALRAAVAHGQMEVALLVLETYRQSPVVPEADDQSRLRRYMKALLSFSGKTVAALL